MNDRTVKWPIKVAVLSYLAVTLWWCLPDAQFNDEGKPATTLDAALSQSFTTVRSKPIQTFYTTTGLWQYWDMFAPNPLSQDWWFDAEVTLQDGTKTIVTYPRMANLPIHKKYLHERFVKYGERVQTQQFEYLWPAWATWLAREAYTDQNNPPVTVQIRKHYRWIPDPDKDRTPREFRQEVVYEHLVNPQDLGAFTRETQSAVPR
jgi:hypothetical protein